MEERIFKLLIKKISEELSEEELSEVDNLIAKDDEIFEEYQTLKGIWNKIQPESSEANLEKLNERISENVIKQKIFFVREALKYAAIVIFFVFSFSFLFTHKKTITIKNTTNKNLVVNLPDNSKVILKESGQIAYKIGLFSDFNRKIDFTGTAFFDISHNGDNFTVKCNDLDVVVMGTAFNIEQSDQRTEVTLLRGKVKISDFKGKCDTSVIMSPGELVAYYPESKKIVHKKINPAVNTFWIEDKIIFNNFSMSEIAMIMKKYYGKTLVFNDSLSKNKHIGGSAPTDDADMIIQAISIITKTNTIVKNDTVIFEKTNK